MGSAEMGTGMTDTKKAVVKEGRTALGIEFGSTRIKAVLIDETHQPIAMGTHDWENRLENGIAAQVAIFGEGMNEAWKKSHINRRLADNCFGDYYTRTGLDLKQREMITFCFLMVQGGCEPQLIAHAKGNMNLGNDSAFLTRVVSQCLPYIGYPRSLNAISCIHKAAEA